MRATKRLGGKTNGENVGRLICDELGFGSESFEFIGLKSEYLSFMDGKGLGIHVDHSDTCKMGFRIGGIACHTGRQSCFYRVLKDGQWQTVDAVIKDPKELYEHPKHV